MWQLKKISTNESLNEPQRLPENWGPIFGMNGFKDRIGNLSWLGVDYADMGWFEVGEEEPEVMTSEKANATIAQILENTAWSVASDTPSTKGQRADWLSFRQAIREIPLQAGFPKDIKWPSEPR